MTAPLTFTSTIINPDWAPSWAVVEVPGSNEYLGTGNSVKATTTVDSTAVTSALMPSGRGYHFISLSKAVRKQLGKDVGDTVDVRVER